MLTPFDVRDRVTQIKKEHKAHKSQLSNMRYRIEIARLYRDILQEIAKGSIDPRSLAQAGLEVEKP